MDSTLKWFLGAFAVGSGILLLTRASSAMTTATPAREPTEAEDIADWRRKMGLPPETAAPASAVAASPRQRIVLCIGDSITAFNGGYFNHIKLPGNGLVSGDSKGWGGKNIATITKNAIPVVKKIHPTDVVLLAGVNDVANHMVAKRTIAQAVAKIQKDLTNAWTKIRDAGAKVYAVKLTPWFGYAKYFGPKASRAADFRETTLRVNQWMDSMRGQPGGPDVVIDTAPMGDDQYRLKKEFSAGDLHPSKQGSLELARLIAQAL